MITGASDGIGRASAVELARAGLDVVLVARRAEALERLAADLASSHGVEARVVAADLAQPAEVRRVCEATADLEVGLLVAAAGFGTSGPFLASSLDLEVEALRVNCEAVLRMANAFGQRFKARGRGGLVLMSSLVAFQGVPFAAGYSATKAYVQSLAEALHLELTVFGVDVLASAPGPVSSGFGARAGMKMNMTVASETVASGTLRALGHRMTVRPGWLSKVLEALLTLPRAMRVRIMRLVMGGMTRHQRAA